jgi:hypothetical protein
MHLFQASPEVLIGVFFVGAGDGAAGGPGGGGLLAGAQSAGGAGRAAAAAGGGHADAPAARHSRAPARRCRGTPPLP